MTKLACSQFTRRQARNALLIFGGAYVLGGMNVWAQPTIAKSQGTHALAANPGRHPSIRLGLPQTPTLPSPTRSGLVAVNGMRLFFAQFGAGPPVLLIHGGLANSNYWGYQVKELAQRFSVTVMDTRGHGRSPVMSHVFGYRVFAEDVVSLLDFLNISSASIVGWSDGAITGLQLAMTQPSRVTKLFAFAGNSSVSGMKPDTTGMLASYAARCKIEYARISPRPERWPELLAGLRVMWRTEPNFTKQQLATINCPTMISDGEYDEIIKRADTELMARKIPGAQLVIQRDVSHFAMLQNPGEFNRILFEFLGT